MKKILLIGDSIRLGYDVFVKDAFEHSAKVYYPDENCRFAKFVFRHLHDWKRELGLGDDMDLIHWNAGLWDNLRLLDGELFTDIDQYKADVERICKTIELLFPKAKMIFATSTPVQEELFGDCKRYNHEIRQYNEAAIEIVKKHGGEINDLYSHMDAAPVEYHSDLTHYYSRSGTAHITSKVVEYISKSLSIAYKTPDYDAWFKETESYDDGNDWLKKRSCGVNSQTELGS